MSGEMCHCGQPLHYSSRSLQRAVEAQIRRLGSHVPVTVEDGSNVTYLVPRHYIALHGITGRDLPTLGFQQVVDN